MKLAGHGPVIVDQPNRIGLGIVAAHDVMPGWDGATIRMVGSARFENHKFSAPQLIHMGARDLEEFGFDGPKPLNIGVL